MTEMNLVEVGNCCFPCGKTTVPNRVWVYMDETEQSGERASSNSVCDRYAKTV
ncbi:MAG: hypothetical protein AAGA75_22510 [Cyanobacteria bacterium P01_E01_bin.6]